MSTLNEISQMVVTGQIRTIKAKVQQALDEGIGAPDHFKGHASREKITPHLFRRFGNVDLGKRAAIAKCQRSNRSDR